MLDEVAILLLRLFERRGAARSFGDILRGAVHANGLSAAAHLDASVCLDDAFGTIRQRNTKLTRVRLMIDQRAVEELLEIRLLIRMDILQCPGKGDRSPRLEAKDAVVLVAPGQPAGEKVPFPTADVGKRLRFGELMLQAVKHAASSDRSLSRGRGWR